MEIKFSELCEKQISIFIKVVEDFKTDSWKYAQDEIMDKLIEHLKEFKMKVVEIVKRKENGS